MGKKIKSFAGVMTLTATVYFYASKFRRTHSLRIGFAADFDKKAIVHASRKMKEEFGEAIKKHYEGHDPIPEKIVLRVSTKKYECDMVATRFSE